MKTKQNKFPYISLLYYNLFMILRTIRGSVIYDLIHGFRRTPKKDYQKDYQSARSLTRSRWLSPLEWDLDLTVAQQAKMTFRLMSPFLLGILLFIPCCFIGFLRKFCEDKSKRPKHRMTRGVFQEISYRPLTLGTHRNTPKTAFWWADGTW